ncbi:MAG: hypothetical protein LBQ88_11660 [Treponema sp.]|jgi:hypothetical protein|nr:hypothetical protein [Treponema sp.]
MKKNSFFAGLAVVLLVCAGVFTSCVSSSIDWFKMEIKSNSNTRSQLPNLRNATADTELYQQAETLMSGFLDTRGEAYGYYSIDLRYSSSAPASFLAWTLLHSFTLYLPALLGVPTDSTKFTITAYLNIFDSAGNLVQSLNRTGSFVQTGGIYYGHNPTPKAGKEYSKLFNELLEIANMRSREITDELMAAGPITQENTAAARTRISQFKIQ